MTQPIKIKRFIPLCAAVVMTIALASPIRATDTRVETLGGSALFLKDEDNIWYFPASLLRYPNTLVLSLGGRVSELTPPSELRTAGTFELPRGMVLGAAFGSDEKQVTYAPLAAAEQLHLFWGLSAGGRRYGLRFSRYGAVNSRAPTFERSVSVTEVIAGIESEIGAGNTIEAALSYCGTNFKDVSNGVKRSEPKGYHELASRIRSSLQLTNSVRIVQILTATLGARGARFIYPGQDSETKKEDYFAAQIGAAFEITPQEDLLIIFHASALYDRMVNKSSASSNEPKAITWHLPLAGLGIEKWIRPWLALRVGAMLRLSLDITNEGTYGASSRRQTQASTAQSVGLALHLGGFQADFAVEPMVLKKGPYFMSGSVTPLFFTKVTLRYHL